MKNPFRSEQAAFRLVWLTIGYFALIVIGAEIDRWVGLGVFVVETAAVAIWFSRQRDAQAAEITDIPQRPGGEHRLLVVANETVAGAELLAAIKAIAASRPTEVLVVCPALNTPLRHWASDEDGARAAAAARLEASLAALAEAGISARGEIGDGDPLQAIEDALRTFAPDELLVSTHPRGRSNWLERDVVSVAGERFALPVRHVVVDLDTGAAVTAPAERAD